MSAAYGAKGEGLKKVLPFPKRITYLIDPNGKIAMGYEVSDVGVHPEEVLNDLRARV